MEGQFWLKKVAIGEGPQLQIMEHYAKINADENKFTTATMRTEKGKDKHGNIIYEYMIFYSEKPGVKESPKIDLKPEEIKERKLEM